MRPFELFIVYAALFAVGWPALFGVRSRRGIASGLLFVAVIAQLQVEGYRYQMIPLYILSLGLAIGDIVFLERTLTWPNRVFRGIIGTAGVALAVALPFLLPVPELPVPSGPSSIGTAVIELVDSSREEIYGANPGGPRELVVQVWYPATADSTSEPAGIHPDWEVVGPALSRSIGFPGWFLSHLQYSKSHTFSPAPIAAGSYPVIVYSHGWQGYRSIALNQIETLVSNGYIVIAPDHTYGSVVTRFSDGEVIYSDPAALPDEESVSTEDYEEATRSLVDVYADDITSILNSLDAGVGGVFGDYVESMDLTRIGLYGHSTGGGAAVKVCLLDERCDAVLGLDPWVEPFDDRVLATSALRPAMYIRSVEWQEKSNDAILRGIAERSENVAYWVGVEGTAHNDFVMTPLFSPIADDLGLRGPIPAGRIIPIVNQYLLGFFDVFLLGTGSASIDNVLFDEVTLEIIGSVPATDTAPEEDS
ncbi:MAG TPA: dienelactone hydrolase family protein [Acidimicrobiia bacterium]